MKTRLLLFSFLFFSLTTDARNWYRIYLDSKTYVAPQFSAYHYSASMCGVDMSIPHFVRPKGAVFCRMEDYLTMKTKVWIKIGVK